MLSSNLYQLKTLQIKYLFSVMSRIIVGGKKNNIFPNLPIQRSNCGVTKGKQQYFNLGLTEVDTNQNALVVHHRATKF